MKHLSTPRKRNYSLSSGERTGKSLNLLSLVVLRLMLKRGCKAGGVWLRPDQGVTNRSLAEGFWKELPQKVTVL